MFTVLNNDSFGSIRLLLSSTNVKTTGWVAWVLFWVVLVMTNFAKSLKSTSAGMVAFIPPGALAFLPTIIGIRLPDIPSKNGVNDTLAGCVFADIFRPLFSR